MRVLVSPISGSLAGSRLPRLYESEQENLKVDFFLRAVYFLVDSSEDPQYIKGISLPYKHVNGCSAAINGMIVKKRVSLL